jgi:hypothetical protein
MKRTHFDSIVSELPALVPIKLAAEFMHAHPQTVRDLHRSGELIGVQRKAKQGSPVLISRDSIRDYLARNER